MINAVLIAYDGSKQAEKAFEFGLEMASKYGAQVIVLSIVRPPEPPVNVELQAVLESATEHYQELFKELKAKAAAYEVEPQFEVRAGHPAEQIVHCAEQQGIDVIVMGHRGESFLQRWLLGSVAKRVLSYAHCTVVVVR
ncbi:universal stress protein [Desulfoferrobacter suflitae]|uniref:universal stress protein n=1 Tax=Desulfoferrobacter suflitae TaxID=2865782 RepID=UPI0021640EA4|nr:universal stress protein [Desulfoferrobacter suflitae]MCK8601819.1 universal stress protein [Desulfoferrobacter suflitae]